MAITHENRNAKILMTKPKKNIVNRFRNILISLDKKFVILFSHLAAKIRFVVNLCRAYFLEFLAILKHYLKQS